MIPKPQLVTAPANLPVALSEVKDFLRVDGSGEDDLITAIINAAAKRLEALTDQKFVTQTWDVFYNDFPFKSRDVWWDGTRDGHIAQMRDALDRIDLPFGPLQSVTGVYSIDEDDSEIEFASSNYSVDTAGPYGVVALKIGSSWPTTVLRPVNGVKIRVVVGHGLGHVDDDNPSEVPSDIRESIKQLAGKMYEHRGDEMPKIPAAAMMLVEPYRRLKVGR